MLKRTGFTLIEIVVATVIFCLIVMGMASLFIAGKRHVLHSRDRMSGSEMGKFFVDPLQMDVRQDTWDSAINPNALKLTTTYCDSVGGNPQNPACPPVGNRKINNIDYTVQYDVSVVNPVSAPDLRRVKAQIGWTESAP